MPDLEDEGAAAAADKGKSDETPTTTTTATTTPAEANTLPEATGETGASATKTSAAGIEELS